MTATSPAGDAAMRPGARAAMALALLLAGSGGPAAAATPAPPSAAEIEQRFATRIRPLFAQHCAACHGDGKAKGGFDLDRFASLAAVQADRRTWKHVVDVLGQKLMPPAKRPPLKPEEVAAITTWVNDALAFCDCSGPRDPGRGGMRRLNRAEYANTIRDLLGIEFRASDDFPADDIGYGFDNIADVLSTSPLLIEKYLAAAEHILARAARNDAVRRYSGLDLEPTGEGNFYDNLGRDLAVTVPHRFAIAGTYELRIRVSQEESAVPLARMKVLLDGAELAELDVRAARNRPHTLTSRSTVTAGAHRIEARFVKMRKDQPGYDIDRNLVVEAIEVDGPLGVDPGQLAGSRQALLGSGFTPQIGEDGVRRILARFAGRAFRRPVAAEDLDPLLALYRSARASGAGAEAAISTAAAAVLCSPHFLFRVEAPPATAKPGSSHVLGDHELAARLSYFLWSSMPDDELRELADQQRLRDPAVLAAQAARLLRDARAQALVANFLGQWLELRRIDEAIPDGKRFPGVNGALRAAMRQETELLFRHIISEGRSVLDLLDADYTFLNGPLAKHYGMAGVTGNEFRQVSLAGTRRRGVLGHASVLLITSTPTRTSPVMRGRFVLEQLLDAAPPPPPADVPLLDAQARGGTKATLRQQLERHRAEPRCAVCHQEMDSLGFALEPFDAVGRWRDQDGGQPVDAVGTLPDGTRIDGPDGLRGVLLARRQRFVECLAGKLLTYALGRGLEPGDRCSVQDIAAATVADGYRFPALIAALVRSDAFRLVRAATAAELTTPDAPLGGEAPARRAPGAKP